MDMYTIKSAPVGVVGLGLMGSSIVVSLLAAGHRVVALAPIAGERETASRHIVDLLRHAEKAGMLKKGMQSCLDAVTIVEDYEALSECKFVLECVIENMEIKKSVYHKIAASVSNDTIIASNTSAIPISELQLLIPHPERFLGVHWAEPAYMTRFLEVTCGSLTDPDIADQIVSLGLSWGKEPTLLKKDIRGFITNRLMYAIYREALTLIEQGHITLGDADKACRYDMGTWMTFMGIFRRMDFMGMNDYILSFQTLFPQLSNRQDVPAIMKALTERSGRGIHNLIGFYPYNETEAKAWEEAFADFNKEMYQLASRYNEQNLGLVRESSII